MSSKNQHVPYSSIPTLKRPSYHRLPNVCAKSKCNSSNTIPTYAGVTLQAPTIPSSNPSIPTSDVDDKADRTQGLELKLNPSTLVLQSNTKLFHSLMTDLCQDLTTRTIASECYLETMAWTFIPLQLSLLVQLTVPHVKALPKMLTQLDNLAASPSTFLPSLTNIEYGITTFTAQVPTPQSPTATFSLAQPLSLLPAEVETTPTFQILPLPPFPEPIFTASKRHLLSPPPELQKQPAGTSSEPDYVAHYPDLPPIIPSPDFPPIAPTSAFSMSGAAPGDVSAMIKVPTTATAHLVHQFPFMPDAPAP